MYPIRWIENHPYEIGKGAESTLLSTGREGTLLLFILFQFAFFL